MECILWKKKTALTLISPPPPPPSAIFLIVREQIRMTPRRLVTIFFRVLPIFLAHLRKSDLQLQSHVTFTLCMSASVMAEILGWGGGGGRQGKSVLTCPDCPCGSCPASSLSMLLRRRLFCSSRMWIRTLLVWTRCPMPLALSPNNKQTLHAQLW